MGIPNSLGKILKNNARSQKFRNLTESSREILENAYDAPWLCNGRKSPGITHIPAARGQPDALDYLLLSEVLERHMRTSVSCKGSWREDSDALYGSGQLLVSSAFKLRSTGDNSQNSSCPCLQGEPRPSAKGLRAFLLLWQQLLRSHAGGQDTEVPRRDSE